MDGGARWSDGSGRFVMARFYKCHACGWERVCWPDEEGFDLWKCVECGKVTMPVPIAEMLQNGVMLVDSGREV